MAVNQETLALFAELSDRLSHKGMELSEDAQLLLQNGKHQAARLELAEGSALVHVAKVLVELVKSKL